MKKMIALSALLLLPVIADTASAGTCRNAIDSAAKRVFSTGALTQVCVGHDTSLKDNSPFIYVNPDGACDIGLRMPGLPSFGIGAGSLDLCAMAKTVLGPMVGQVNGALQSQMNTAVGTINQQTQATVGTGVLNNEIDITEMLKGQVIQPR